MNPFQLERKMFGIDSESGPLSSKCNNVLTIAICQHLTQRKAILWPVGGVYGTENTNLGTSGEVHH